MHYTIEALVTGEDAGDWYRVAVQHWQQVLASVDTTNTKAIAALADGEQGWFEQNCGGRYIGQEVMVVSGIGQYYRTSDGFNDRLEKAKAMYNGLRTSMCSVEIHHHADEMAKSYPELLEEES